MQLFIDYSFKLILHLVVVFYHQVQVGFKLSFVVSSRNRSAFD